MMTDDLISLKTVKNKINVHTKRHHVQNHRKSDTTLLHSQDKLILKPISPIKLHVYSPKREIVGREMARFNALWEGLGLDFWAPSFPQCIFLRSTIYLAEVSWATHS